MDIYDYIKSMCKINHINYTFVRDYILYPLKKSNNKVESMDRNDLYYLLNVCNMSQEKIGKLLHVKPSVVNRFIREYNLPRYHCIDIDMFSNIDNNELTRDYIHNPLKLIYNNKTKQYSIEKPSKDDLMYLYFTKNYTREMITRMFRISLTELKKWFNYYGIIKSIGLCIVNRKEKINDRIYNIYVSKYGDKVASILTDKIKMQKFLIENNINNYRELAELLDVDYSTVNRIIKKLGLSTHIKSFNSKNEEMIYNELSKHFGVIKTQYKDERYPYNCDYYIPSIDTFIEYQGFITHGDKSVGLHLPYNSHNKRHVKYANKLKEMGKDNLFYYTMWNTWCIKDVMKRETARMNNLNYLEFFDLEDFYIWFDNLTNKEI